MTFTPRTFATIRDDMINYLRVQSNLTDFEIGSVIRTLVEAASLEDDEQYFQMVQLLDAFSIQNAQGAVLDKRVADYGIRRLQPASATGQVSIQNDNLVRSTLLFSVSPAGTTLSLGSSSAFPTAGYPYTVRIGEGTSAVEDVSVSANNNLTGVLTCSALLNSHTIGDRVAYVDGTADKILAPGVQVQVPGSSINNPILAITTESGTLVNGNLNSTPITAKAVVPGKAGNVGVGQISQFTSAAPFTGALVTNLSNFAGGRDLETDAQLRDRARLQLQSLARGTVLALQQQVLGVTDAITGQRVVTANVLEDYILGEVVVYIDDGTGFIPDQVHLARSTVNANIGAPTTSVVVLTAANFPAEGAVLIGSGLSTAEFARYSSVNYGTNTITLTAPTAQNHAIGDEVVLLDVVKEAADPGTTFFMSSTRPIVRNSQRLWVATGTTIALKSSPTDYIIDRGTGQIQLVNQLPVNSMVLLTYSYYTGLIATVQKVLDGDKNDPVNFDGVRSGGIVLVVETPIIHRISVRLSITPAAGFTKSQLIPRVQDAVSSYISSLGIGNDVLLAAIIERAMLVAGVQNVVVAAPLSDVVILNNELPLPYDSSGNSLVTVS